MRILSKVIIALVFILAGVLFVHNLTSINADIGRHIKVGEIIWQTGDVPKTNLFSYTAPEFPFINHHWLSEVVFYGIYSLGGDWMSGLRSVMVLKVIVLLATYFLLFLTIRRYNIFAVALSFLVSIFVFSARTEPRPEIFSYLIFAAYLLVLYRIRELPTSQVGYPQNRLAMSVMWILPILQVFWVNLHIYFVIGPIIFLFFLIDKFINSKFKNYSFIQNSKLEIKIFILVILANLANPSFINGALYPLRVLNNYGYSVAENSSLFFLAKYFGRWAPQDKLFLVSLFILAGSFVLSFWRNKFMVKLTTSNVGRPTDIRCRYVKKRIFDLLLVSMTAILSFKMQRNIPLFALSLWPVLSENLSGIFNLQFSIYNKFLTFNLKKILHFTVILILMASIYFVASGEFYNRLDSAKIFGLGISSAAQDGTDFIKDNQIQGPVFNNFDIGSYLTWQLYPVRTNGSQGDPTSNGTSPEQRVFVDGRPEAYPVEFFDKVYKPMQRDEKIWQELSEKYGINYIFFAHTDMTEWANEFLTRISKDKKWPLVFVNDAVVVFLKNTNANQSVIDQYQVTEQNIIEKLPQVLNNLNKNDDNAFINFGNALYRFRWLDASAKVYETLTANQPNNPYGYQGAAYAYVTMNDPVTQEKAAQNLEKAIDLGFQTFNNYFTLGIINGNLGNLFAAEENIKKALRLNPESQNARQVLEVIKRKQGLN